MIKRFTDMLHAYVDFNFRTISGSPDMKKLEEFLELLPENDKKAVIQLIRLKGSGRF